jgi:transposase
MLSCKTSLILFDDQNDNERPYVNINVNNLTLCGLLDSGSSISILGNNAHKTLLERGFVLNSSYKITVRAANGQSVHSIGYINLSVQFNDHVCNITAHVIPDISSHLILGIDFWKGFNLLPRFLRNVELKRPSNCTSLTTQSDKQVLPFDDLSEEQQAQANIIISRFREASTESAPLGRTHLIEHRIDTGDHAPIRQRCYRLSPEKQKVLVEEVDKMLALDIIEPCESPWLSPVLVTPKKDGSWRFCLDSRKLNAVTKKDAYKLPLINEILDNLRDARYLSSIDIAKAFWEVPLREEDRDKSAFYVNSRGMFRFKVTPFGLTNAPATQQRLMDQLFTPEFENRVFWYLDDIIVISNTFEDHISLLTRVLDKLKYARLTINFEKSVFFRRELKYLGYIVDHNGLRTDPDKVKAILDIPVPTTKRELKRFLGTASWYRRFVPNFSTLAAPLNLLTSTGKKAPPFRWNDEANVAFNKIKQALVSSPILTCPDFSKTFSVHCDASNFGIGAMLTQEDNGIEKPIAYFSRSLSKQQQNYSITERELLSVIVALEHWQCYLDNGQKFVVYTDHAALKWFLNLDNPSGRLARWSVRLSAFNFDIHHKKGRDHVVPDILSRSVPVDLVYVESHDDWFNNIIQGCQENPTSFPDYKYVNNNLYKLKRTSSLLTSEYDWKLVIPKEMRKDIIRDNHSQPTAGHFGIFKTHKRISLRYFWPGMYRDVCKYIAGCETCLAYKYQNHQTLGIMGKPKECCRPFQCLSIDLVGTLPMTRKQNRYILVVNCCFSKYCLIFPIKKATSSIICKILEDFVFLVHGFPRTIIMDNGTQFISNELQELFTRYHIPEVHFTPKYCPQVNNVERYNRTIMTAISSFVENDHRNWDLNIPKIQFAMNTSVNEVTGFSPAFLAHGRELVTCGSFYGAASSGDVDYDDLIFAPRDKYAENLGYLSPILDKVQAAIWDAHMKNCKYYNLRRKQAEFEEGDIVWRRNYQLSDAGKYFTAKLAPKFVKCTVIKKLSPLVYELADCNGRAIGRWHIKDLKL